MCVMGCFPHTGPERIQLARESHSANYVANKGDLSWGEATN